MSACYHVQYHLNEGRPIGTSIPATEHSVMTAWPDEEGAMKNQIEHFGHSLFACVMDSYDYDNALNVVWLHPTLRQPSALAPPASAIPALVSLQLCVASAVLLLLLLARLRWGGALGRTVPSREGCSCAVPCGGGGSRAGACLL